MNSSLRVFEFREVLSNVGNRDRFAAEKQNQPNTVLGGSECLQE